MQPRFPEIWTCWRIPGVRTVDGTYGATSLNKLPVVEAPDDLSWLPPFDRQVIAKLDAKRLRGAEALAPYFERAERLDDAAGGDFDGELDQILAQAVNANVRLPAAFLQLFRSRKMQSRFFNPTGCEFDLPQQGMTPAPFGSRGWIIRFLNDQQGCLSWYLFIPPSGNVVVLSSSETQFAMALEEHDPNNREHVSAVLGVTHLAAHSFPEFLYRFWIEAALWFKCQYKLSKTPTEERYLRGLTVST
ncbi:MAG: hypothetical protein U1E03_08585 [Hyphomonadaceae bacterium]